MVFSLQLIQLGILQDYKKRMKTPYPFWVEVPVVVCSWYLKYSVHMLDMSDVIIDVMELYLKCE